MKKALLRIITFIGLVGAGIALAQTALQPTPIDWRFALTWDDLSTNNMTANWTVMASNNVAVRIAQSRATTIDLQPVLNGAPAGIYALSVVATSTLGDVSDQSTNLFVVWPGGNGKIRGGGNMHVGK